MSPLFRSAGRCGLTCGIGIISLMCVGISALAQTGNDRTSLLRARLAAELESVWQDQLRDSPESASTLGDKRFDDRLTDYSVAGMEASWRRGKEHIRVLDRFPASRMSRQDRLSIAIALYNLHDQQMSAAFKEWEMPVTQFYGFHREIPTLMSQVE